MYQEDQTGVTPPSYTLYGFASLCLLLLVVEPWWPPDPGHIKRKKNSLIIWYNKYSWVAFKFPVKTHKMMLPLELVCWIRRADVASLFYFFTQKVHIHVSSIILFVIETFLLNLSLTYQPIPKWSNNLNVSLKVGLGTMTSGRTVFQ